MKQKRYVKEFASDFIAGYPDGKYKEEVRQKCNKITSLYERGLITALEAVREITEIYYRN